MIRRKDYYLVTAITFAELGLAEPLLRALERANLHTPTPIQANAVPPAMRGRDLIGLAQTGTGKTAAFLLPTLHRMISQPYRVRSKHARALILSPTRELATQIAQTIKLLAGDTKLRQVLIMGGVGYQRQIDRLRGGADILIATPGRLLDLARDGHINLSATQTVILDEADRMLDMGFIHDVRRIMGLLPDERQTLMFSATMAPAVAKLADMTLRNPEKVEIKANSLAVDKIDQMVYHLPTAEKRKQLDALLSERDVRKIIVFTRTKHGANRVVKHLDQSGIRAEAIHGNKSQNARKKTLDNFRSGHLRVLVATDIASRGIDVEDVSHVINFELPNEPESYVHRIGRTARAGAEGTAITLCDEKDRPQLRSIERLLKHRIRIVGEPLSGPANGPSNSEKNVGQIAPKKRRNRRRRFRRTSQRAA